jgi:hypothetical protein
METVMKTIFKTICIEGLKELKKCWREDEGMPKESGLKVGQKKTHHGWPLLF